MQDACLSMDRSLQLQDLGRRLDQSLQLQEAVQPTVRTLHLELGTISQVRGMSRVISDLVFAGPHRIQPEGSRLSGVPKTETRVVAYVRVSTDKQGDHGVSLEAQEAKVRAYATLHDLVLVDVVVETESAKSLDRPGLTRALAMLGDSADALLVTKLDRLTRSVRDLGTLIEERFGKGSKAALLSVSEHVDTRTAAGRMVLNIMASVAQAEREMIGERTSVAMQHMKARGQYTGGPAPYGMRHTADGLRPHEAEACTRGRASELRAQGLSLRAVSVALAAEGMVSRTGAAFVPAAISKMLLAA